MTVHRVFVVWTNPLFHESVRLLLKHPDVIWVGTATDFSTARDEIRRLRPDTVLFEKTDAAIPLEVMGFLELDTKGMRIVELSLEDNEISVFHRQHQIVGKAEDLLHIILG